MPPAKNLSGKKFGKLLAIEPTKTRTISGKIVWKCLCDCGNVTYVNCWDLSSSNTKSCGCTNRERFKSGLRRLPNGQASRNKLFSNYSLNAKKRHLGFEISLDEFEILVKSNCYYCGKKPNQVFKFKGSNGNYIYNGIDRVDNSLGYTVDNCVPCCKECNFNKGSITIDTARKMINFTDARHKKPVVGYIGATMDLPHKGHINLINRAKEQCDFLIVSLNTDEFIQEFKGKPPVMSLSERMCVIENIKAVDKVIINMGGKDSKLAILSCKPDKIFVGDDYNFDTYCKQMDFTKEWLDNNNIEVIIFPRTPNISTTEIKQRMKENGY